MAKTNREPITKKLRFEVFKKDKFTCQYCGKSAPEVILEVDHILPVAEGGTNDLINLITSCRDCNRGKGKTLLSNDQMLEKQKQQIAELAERREQAEMMLEWKNELVKFENSQAVYILEYISHKTGWAINGETRIEICVAIKKLVKQFSFSEVLEAAGKAVDYYYDGSIDSWYNAFYKIGGICYNKRRRQNGDL